MTDTSDLVAHTTSYVRALSERCTVDATTTFDPLTPTEIHEAATYLQELANQLDNDGHHQHDAAARDLADRLTITHLIATHTQRNVA